MWVDGRLVYNNLLSVARGHLQVQRRRYCSRFRRIADDGILDLSLIRPVHFWHLLFRFHYLFNGGIYWHPPHPAGARQPDPDRVVAGGSLEADGESPGHTPLEIPDPPTGDPHCGTPDFPD